MMIAPQVANIIEGKQEELASIPLSIYPYSIDPDIQASKINKIVVLITEINDNPYAKGSDKTISKEAFAQIQLFFPVDFDKDTSEVRENIANLLEKHGWYLNMDNGIERDPDTGNLFNTSHFRKEYKRKLR